jgi:hypothetical protein
MDFANSQQRRGSRFIRPSVADVGATDGLPRQMVAVEQHLKVIGIWKLVSQEIEIAWAAANQNCAGSREI